MHVGRGQGERHGAGKRSVRKNEFWYETKGILNGRADVTIFELK